jgi:NADH-quinone oxidoreductase subunit L
VFEQVQAGHVGETVLLGIALLLFMGAMGKSAQFPLHVWLPDAMEGPTPVSALIHAATMVTAGVYLVARSAVIFASAPASLIVVGAIGTFTAIFAAVIGICQKDIKKVLAYSTVSQLGYMFMALGVGAWAVAIFHLVTHAFFKALLFLGAGSVIHSLNGEQDMDKMGGLAKKIPATYWTLVAGALALSGIFPFAGFWSKDDILGATWRDGKYYFWAIGLIAAFITAFYTFRMIFKTFFGRPQTADGSDHHVHKSPLTMIVPLAVLAVASLLGGFLGLPGRLGVIQHFLEPVFAPANHILGLEEHGLAAADYVLMVVSLVVAMCGIALAWVMYVKRVDLPLIVGARLRPLYNVVYNKFYVDEFYGATFVKLAVDGSTWVWHQFDEKVIDGAAHGTAWLWQHAGSVVRPLQTGRVQNYLLWMFAGVFVIVTVVVIVTV